MKTIVLRSSTFLWTIRNEGFLYNVESGTNYSFLLNDSTIKDVCSQWEVLDNLYVAHFDDSVASDTFNQFCEKIKDLSMGEIASPGKTPIAFPPRLKVKYSVETFNHLGRNISAEPILPSMMRLVVFIGGKGDTGDMWKQSLCHMTSEEVQSPDNLVRFLSLYNTPGLMTIDIITSDRELDSLPVWIESMEPFKEKTRFVISSSDLALSSPEITLLLTAGFKLTVFCTEVPANTVKWAGDRSYYLPVRSESDYNQWSTLLGSADSGLDYSIVPIADDNLDFFKENIFLSEEEIRSQKLSYRDIFRHQALNVNQFGTFYVFPDGTVHPAADAPAIGTLEDSAHQLIIRELEENHAWRQTRRLMEPCKNCIFHDICPSPSVYERILGVPGCTYWKE